MTCPPEREARRWKTALVISDRDNVATALEPLEPGSVIDIAGRRVEIVQRIPPGHKVALTRIAEGEQVVKYGSAIGRALAEIAEGTHVHTHNLVSTRGRGDLGQAKSATEARLAEPDDDDLASAFGSPTGSQS